MFLKKAFMVILLIAAVVSFGTELVSKEMKSEKYGDIELVSIQGGSFLMGSPSTEKERLNDEIQHKVTVSPFMMSKYEITQKVYNEITGTNPSLNNPGDKGAFLPVENVSWNEAVEFCNRLSEKHSLSPYYKIEKKAGVPGEASDGTEYNVTITGGNGFRLPTEAEWEIACRGGSKTPFHYGKTLNPSMANFDGRYPYGSPKGIYRDTTLSVGSFKPNALGLYDMHGNVNEWCWDRYGKEYYKTGSVKDPAGAEKGSRVYRGGSYMTMGQFVRSAARGRLDAADSSRDIGFRIVRSIK